MKSQSRVPTLFGFANDQQLPSRIDLSQMGRKLKTNGSLLSDKSQFSKNRIPTINKDYSFVIMDKSWAEENVKDQNPTDQVSIPPFHDDNQQEKTVESYKNWLYNSREGMLKHQGYKALQQYSFKTVKQKQSEPNRDGKVHQSNVSIKHSQNHDTKSNKSGQVKKENYIMIQISSISDIIQWEFQKFNHQQTNNQLYCKLVISLIDEQGTSIPKQYPKKIATEMIRLDRKENNEKKAGYKLPQAYFADLQFSLYFHTEKQSLYIKIELFLYEVEKHSTERAQEQIEIKQQAQIVARQKAFSYVKVPINLKKLTQNSSDSQRLGNTLKHLRKTFQSYDRQYLADNQQNDPKTKSNPPQQKENNSFGVLNFSITNSEYYRILSKFIPSEYLVWHQDFIPGLLGGHLPKVDDMLFHLSPSTEAKSLHLEIQSLQVQGDWFLKGKQKAQKLIKSIRMARQSSGFNSQNTQTLFNLKSTNLSLNFHNGIKEISRTSCPLIETMELQKRLPPSSNQQISAKYLLKSQNNTNILPVKVFSSSILYIPHVFFQPNCFVILQIEQKAQIKELNHSSKQERIEQFLIPVAFAFLEPEKIMNNKPMQTRLFEGWYFDVNVFQRQKRIKTAKNLVLGSLNNVIETRSNISNKTKELLVRQMIFSKMGLICSLKDPDYDRTWLLDRSKLQESILMKNPMFPSGNITSRSLLFNSEQARIQAQKQKVLKKISNVMTKEMKREKKIQVREEIILLDNPQSLYLTVDVQVNKNVQKKCINDLKDFLNQQLQSNLKIRKVNQIKSQNPIDKILLYKSQKLKQKREENKIYRYCFDQTSKTDTTQFRSYSDLFQLVSIKPASLIQPSHSCYSPNLYRMLYSLPQNKDFLAGNNPYSRMTQNNSMAALESKDNLSQYGYEKTPIELIRTELAQINYNYLILINPLSIKPLQTASNSFFSVPNKFFLKIFFWNMENASSPCFQLDPETGEVVVFIKESQTSPIIEKGNKNKNINEIKFKNRALEGKKQIELRKENDVNRLKLKKVFHFEYGCEQSFANSKQLFVDFIDYLYNGLMEVRVYDQFREIGKSYFKLRNLLRKRKNQTSSIHQEYVYSKQGPILQMKLECKSLRKQKPPKNISKRQLQPNQQNKLQQNTKQALSKQKIPSQQILNLYKNQKVQNQKDRSSNLTESKQMFGSSIIDKQKERIQRFKKLKEVNNKDPQQKQKESLQRIIERNYLISEYKFKTFSFRKSFFLIELENRSHKKGLFYVNFTDDDYPYYHEAYPNPEMKIIKNFHSEILEQDKQKILAIQSNRQRLLKYRKLNDNYEIQLEADQKIIVVCQYESKRKYCPQEKFGEDTKQDQLLNFYNHKHTITLSLLESANRSAVTSLAKIHIFPEPSQTIIQIKQTIKKGKKQLVSLPFLLSEIMKEKYEIYMNESKCSIIYQGDQIESQRVFNSTAVSEARHKYSRSPKHERTKMMDWRPEEVMQQMAQVKFQKNVSIFGNKNKDFIQEEEGSPKMSQNRHMNSSGNRNYNKTVRQKWLNFISIYLPAKPSIGQESTSDYNQPASQQHIGIKQLQLTFIPKKSMTESQPFSLDIIINQVQNQQMMKIPIFEPIKSTFKIHHKSIQQKNGRIPKVIGVICESLQFKTKSFWIELDLKKSYTEVEFKYTSTIYGIRSFSIILIDPLKYSTFYNNAINSEAIVSQLEQSYLHRVLFTVMTPFPALKAQLVINLPLNYSSSKQGYDEPFAYANSSVHNTVFHIYTSHPWFLCLQDKDKVCQIKAKTQKKLKLKINVKRIIEEYLYAMKGPISDQNDNAYKLINERQRITQSNKDILPIIVVGFVSDRVVEHFGFVFKIV